MDSSPKTLVNLAPAVVPGAIEVAEDFQGYVWRVLHRDLGRSAYKVGGAHPRVYGHCLVRRNLATLDALPNHPLSPVHSLAAPERCFSWGISSRLPRTIGITLGSLPQSGACSFFPFAPRF